MINFLFWPWPSSISLTLWNLLSLFLSWAESVRIPNFQFRYGFCPSQSKKCWFTYLAGFSANTHTIGTSLNHPKKIRKTLRSEKLNFYERSTREYKNFQKHRFKVYGQAQSWLFVRMVNLAWLWKLNYSFRFF